MNPNLSGPQMRRAEVYTDPESSDDPRWGKYGKAAPHTVLDATGQSVGRYSDESLALAHPPSGIQGALFPGPKQTDHGYKETRSVRSVRDGLDDRDWNPQESGEVARTLAKTDIPRGDLEGIETRVHTHSPYSWGEQSEDRSLAREGRSFFTSRKRLGGGDQIHMAPGQEADPESVTHELGHAVHYAGVDLQHRRPGTERQWITPQTGASESPHPVLEGAADGYADRYSGAHDQLVVGSSREPVGDSSLRNRAAQVFGMSHERHIGYTGKYYKTPGDQRQEEWNPHDRVRYLAARQFAGLTGAGMHLGDVGSTPEVGLIEKTAMETGHMLLQADEAHRASTGASRNRPLEGMIHDALDTDLGMSDPRGEKSRSQRVDEFLTKARETAIRHPMRPRGYRSSGDNPQHAVNEANYEQTTIDGKPENYRLATFKAQHLEGR